MSRWLRFYARTRLVRPLPFPSSYVSPSLHPAAIAPCTPVAQLGVVRRLRPSPVNESRTKPARKPYFLSDAEWVQALYASRVSLITYVFPPKRLLIGVLALLFSSHGFELRSAQEVSPLSMSYTFHSTLFFGVSFLLFVATLSRALDWRSKRKLVFRKPVDAPRQNTNATNA